MRRKIITYLVLAGLMKSISGQTFQIFDNDSEQGSSFTLYCSFVINGPISFTLYNVAKGSCGAPFGGKPGTCTPNAITQNLTDSITSWTISPAEPEHHGIWKCTRGIANSNEVMLTIYKLPGQVLSQNGISSNTIVNDTSLHPISVLVDCLFSENGPSVELQFVEAGTSSASVMMDCTNSSTICSTCTGCSIYRCNYTVSLYQEHLLGDLRKDIPYTMDIKVGVTGTTQTFKTTIFSPHTITFTSTSVSEKPQDNCSLYFPRCFGFSLIGTVIGICVTVLYLYCTLEPIGGPVQPDESVELKTNWKEIKEVVLLTLPISLLWDVVAGCLCMLICSDEVYICVLVVLFGLVKCLVIAYIAKKYIETQDYRYLLVLIIITIVGIIIIVILWLYWVKKKKGTIVVLYSSQITVVKYDVTVIVIVCGLGFESCKWKKSSLDGNKIDDVESTKWCKFLPTYIIIQHITKDHEGVYFCMKESLKSKTLALKVDGVAAAVSSSGTTYTIKKGESIQIQVPNSLLINTQKWEWRMKDILDRPRKEKKQDDNQFGNKIKKNNTKVLLIITNITKAEEGVYNIVSLGAKPSVLGSIILYVVDDIITIGEKSKVVTRQEGESIEIQYHSSDDSKIQWSKMDKWGEMSSEQTTAKKIKSMKEEDSGIYQCKTATCTSGLLMLRINRDSKVVSEEAVCHTVFEGEQIVMKTPKDNSLILTQSRVKKNDKAIVLVPETTEKEQSIYIIEKITKTDEGTYKLKDKEHLDSSGLSLNVVDDIILVGDRLESHIIQKGRSVSLLPCIEGYGYSSSTSMTWKLKKSETTCTQLILKNIQNENGVRFDCRPKDSGGNTVVSCTIIIADTYLSVGQKRLSVNANVGESVYIQYNECVPKWLKQEWTKVPVNNGSNVKPTPIENGDSNGLLVFKDIRMEDEGVYNFKAVNTKDDLIMLSAPVTVIVRQKKQKNQKKTGEKDQKNTRKDRKTGAKDKKIQQDSETNVKGNTEEQKNGTRKPAKLSPLAKNTGSLHAKLPTIQQNDNSSYLGPSDSNQSANDKQSESDSQALFNVIPESESTEIKRSKKKKKNGSKKKQTPSTGENSDNIATD